VREHRNIVDVHTWMGPAGIGAEYRKLHAEDPKMPQNMGMHPLAIYVRGTDASASVLRAHAEYITRLKNEGKLGAAGPFTGTDSIAGMVVFKRIPLDEAQALVNSDPAVAGGALRVEFHQWFNADHVLPW
jgi:uncharacterized protein YciI